MKHLKILSIFIIFTTTTWNVGCEVSNLEFMHEIFVASATSMSNFWHHLNFAFEVKKTFQKFRFLTCESLRTAVLKFAKKNVKICFDDDVLNIFENKLAF